MMCALVLMIPLKVQATSDEGSVITEEIITEESSTEEDIVEENSTEDITADDVTEESDEETVAEENKGAAVTEENDEKTVTEREGTEASTEDEANIPDVVGMPETEALTLLEENTSVKVIKTYEYMEAVEADLVAEQKVETDADNGSIRVELIISMGPEPTENLNTVAEDANILSTFGLARYIQPEDSYDSEFGIDWESLPESYEYNWDNSQNCWQWGVWVDGECYKTPEGEYSTDVRHKIQMYCDGTNVYLRIVFSRDYGAKFNGEDYQIWIDGQMAAFQVEKVGGGTITGNMDSIPVGTTQVEVRHRDSRLSYSIVADSQGYLTKHEDNINAELELKIPLSAMEEQNPNIDLDNIGMIEFFTPNLMYRRMRGSGASTAPLASAVAAFLVIPGSTAFIKKYGKKKKHSDEVVNEENV